MDRAGEPEEKSGTHATEEKATSPETIASLIPEIYYDLIARVFSGIPFVMILLWMYDHGKPYRQIEPAQLTLIIIGSGYLAGHLLTTVSTMVNVIIWRKWLIRWMFARLALSNPFRADRLASVILDVYKRVDFIGDYDRPGGAILKKMEAGAAMTDNLLSGTIIIGIIYLIWFRVSTSQFVSGLTFLVLLIFSVVLRRMCLISRQDGILSKLTPDARLKLAQFEHS